MELGTEISAAVLNVKTCFPECIMNTKTFARYIYIFSGVLLKRNTKGRAHSNIQTVIIKGIITCFERFEEFKKKKIAFHKF